jgi:hypothetical protein
MTDRGEGFDLYEDRWRPVGLAIGSFGPLAVAAVLVPVRQHLAASNVALIFVVVVVVAALGGWLSGLIGALVSTLSFDFFFTRPYESLTIDRAAEIEATFLLLAISLIVGGIVAYARHARKRAERRSVELVRLNRIADMVATGAELEDVLLSVQAELIGLLSLRECRFQENMLGDPLPVLQRTGAIEGGKRQYVGGELSLPAEGVELLVLGRGRLFGRFVLIPNWNVGIAVPERQVAIGLADQLGAALAADLRPPEAQPGALGDAG